MGIFLVKFVFRGRGIDPGPSLFFNFSDSRGHENPFSPLAFLHRALCYFLLSSQIRDFWNSVPEFHHILELSGRGLGSRKKSLSRYLWAVTFPGLQTKIDNDRQYHNNPEDEKKITATLNDRSPKKEKVRTASPYTKMLRAHSTAFVNTRDCD